jgi:hypothetical protein
MKNFISFVKRKGLYVESSDVAYDNAGLVHQLNHELMSYGYVMTRDLFEKLALQSGEYIGQVYTDLLGGIKETVGGGGHEPIYRNFPQSVLALSYKEFAINAIMHYWSFGTWRPEDADYVKREFKLEVVNYKPVSLISREEFESIFTDLLYSGSSLSAFDKKVVDWFIEGGYPFAFNKITFKETSAYVGKRLLDNPKHEKLPTRDATSVLRIWAAYSGGDEGLKENTRFRKPTARQKRVLLATLNECYNTEESFKLYREQWLKVLFYLNPQAGSNAKKYEQTAWFANLLRNEPKSLRTFNSRVEELFNSKNPEVLSLLQKRPSAFARRLDHAVRVFGYEAVEKWTATGPGLTQLVSTYNHFTDRDQAKERSAVLASQSKSEVVTYDALAPLDKKLVSRIKDSLMTRIRAVGDRPTPLAGKRVYIDRSLYYRPLATNNRASSMSLDGRANGTVEAVPAKSGSNTVRLYVHWEGRHDIDLSAFIIDADNNVVKVGWNGRHHSAEAVVYSGDNTGYSAKNAEYIDVNLGKLQKNAEWIVVEARIFRGPNTFKKWSPGRVRAGWMLRAKPEANQHWLPETIDHSVVLESASSTAYLMALHVPTKNVAYLDVAMGNAIVSTNEDAVKMRTFLENIVTLDDGSPEVKWDKINQGHIIHVLAPNRVEKREEAEVVFDENTTWESISKYL